MRYIRTKDGRIGKVTHEDNKNYRAKFGRKCPLFSKEEVIKQADTIEELCDGFVYSDNVFKNVIYENYNALKILLKIRKNYIVFGAIWTDKGLIYVAKMNEKGELDLL